MGHTEHTDRTPTVSGPEPGWHARVELAPIEAGTRLGRYRVTRELGHGGMGLVVAARDPELDREVAIKVLRLHTLSDTARDRLLREARAMAQLSHPHVVPVYDVDVDDRFGPLVVMELVDGTTLRDAMAPGPNDWRRVRSLLVEAGQGLAAAHARGLLHRDFKPRNVMVGHDGRARVTDFGLARAWQDDSHPESSGDLALGGTGSRSDDSLTAVGTVIGTPPYMAPEHFEGRRLTPASDQYAWCICAWELIVGTRPFPQRGLRGKLAKLQGPPPWPREVAVPAHVRRAIRRGLHPDPERRWPDMKSLLDAVRRAPRRGGRLAWALGIPLLVGGFAVASSPADRCADAAIDTAWSSDRADAVHAGIVATGRGHASKTSARVTDDLDRYAQAWQQVYGEVCDAAPSADAALDRRMACLRDARTELEATVELLSRADAAAVDRADAIVEALPDPTRCAEADAGETDAPSVAEAERVAAARAELARARAFVRAGWYDDAHTIVHAVEATSADLEYRPLHTETMLVRATVEAQLGHYDDAASTLVEALRSATVLGQRAEAVEAAIELTHVVGVMSERGDEGEAHAERAWSLVRPGPVSAAARARLQLVTGELRSVQGRHDDAVSDLRDALTAYEALHGPRGRGVTRAHLALARALAKAGDHAQAEVHRRAAVRIRLDALGGDHPELWRARGALAGTLLSLGRYAEAEAEYRAILDANLRELGPDHPSTAGTRNNLALSLAAQGALDAAEVEHRAALAAAERAFGPDHPFVAGARNNLGDTLLKLGRPVDAYTEFRRALELRLRTRGPDHPTVAGSRNNLGLALAGQGRWREAVVEYRAAVDAMTTALGVDHPDTASTRFNLALALSKLDDPSAIAELRAAIEALVAVLGPVHDHVAQAQRELARLLLDTGDDVEALELAERAFAVHETTDGPIGERGQTAFVLAQALRANGGDPHRTAFVARLARERFGRAGPPWAASRAELDAWLAPD